MSHRIALTCALGAALLIGAIVLHQRPPSESSHYPVCLMHKITGWYCPGCGGTRCISALLHGDVASALRMNALLFVLLPLLGVWSLQMWWPWFTQQENQRRPFVSLWLGVILGALVLVFGVLRNLPMAPFRWLAPH